MVHGATQSTKPLPNLRRIDERHSPFPADTACGSAFPASVWSATSVLAADDNVDSLPNLRSRSQALIVMMMTCYKLMDDCPEATIFPHTVPSVSKERKILFHYLPFLFCWTSRVYFHFCRLYESFVNNIFKFRSFITSLGLSLESIYIFSFGKFYVN